MVIRVLAFARIRELLGFAEQSMQLPEAATAREVWNRLSAGNPQLAELEHSTRIARNGEVVQFDVALHGGDEIALLPPVGGG